eukprot:6166149-Pyramimonas_sp.AAC.1
MAGMFSASDAQSSSSSSSESSCTCPYQHVPTQSSMRVSVELLDPAVEVLGAPLYRHGGAGEVGHQKPKRTGLRVKAWSSSGKKQRTR